MKNSQGLLVTLLWICLMMSSGLPALSQDAAPARPTLSTLRLQAFNIDYTVLKKGMTLGLANISLKAENENGLWRHETTAKTSGFLSLFNSTAASEYALLEIKHAMVIPRQHYQIKSSGQENEIQETHYDLVKRIATTKNGTTQHQTNIDTNSFDAQSLQAALIVDLQKGFKQRTYKLLDEGELKSYEIYYEGEELLKTTVGDYQTLKLRQKHGNRETLSWHAPALNFAAVRIKNYRKGKLYTEMQLKKVNHPTL